jgi:nitrate reductase cytochrome c-type subunit
VKKEEDGKGSELAVHWLMRQIVDPEKNPAKTKPGEDALKPFSHKSHEDDDDKSTAKCVECHVTAKRAVRRSDFFSEDSEETKEKQPPAAGCIQCHNSEGQMQQKIEGVMRPDNSKCVYCHAPATMKALAAQGAPLPPPSHFGRKPAAPAKL